jgi:hypothetical protein
MGHVGKLTAGTGLVSGIGGLFVETALLRTIVFNSEVPGIGCVLKRFGGLMIIEDRVTLGCEVEAAL